MRFYFNSNTFVQSFILLRIVEKLFNVINSEIMKRKFGMYKNLGVTTLVL